MKNYFLIALLIAAAGCHKKTSLVISDRDGWQKIAETTVDFQKEKEEINLTGLNTFAKLQLVVFDASIEMQDMDLYYADGKVENIPLRTQMEDIKKAVSLMSRVKKVPSPKLYSFTKPCPTKTKKKAPYNSGVINQT